MKNRLQERDAESMQFGVTKTLMNLYGQVRHVQDLITDGLLAKALYNLSRDDIDL